jgi:hypothetical protein
MGLFFSKIFDRLLSKKEMRILMVGLDAAGKTTSEEHCVECFGAPCDCILQTGLPYFFYNPQHSAPACFFFSQFCTS